MLKRNVVGKANILLSTMLLAGAVSACSLKVEDKARVSVTFPASTSVSQSALSGSLFLSSLSGTPGRTGLVGLPTPTTLDDFNCFGINVTGGEIAPNPAFSSCTNANMPYVGTVGGLASIAGGTVMVDVNTQTDSGNYTFQLFALQSQGTIGCPAMSDAVISQFGSADMSNPVEVGRTSAVISGDTTLNIFASYNPGAPKPMFCPDGNGVPTKLALAGENNPNTIECEAYTVEVQDASGNPANVSFNLPLTLNGAGAGAFYTSSACATLTSTVTVNSGSSTATVYFKGGSAGALSLQVSGAGLTAASLPVSVALPVLAYQSVPSAENATTVFTTQPVVEIRDFYGLPILTANPSVTVQAYSGPACSGAPAGTFSGSTTVAASSGLATFVGLSWSTAETIYLKASAAGMTPVCSPAFIVSPPPGTVPVLSYTGSPYTFTMGSVITPAVPGNSGGAPTACTATPALPSGLSINSSTCGISGTPSGLSGLTTYTINASNGSGSATPVNIDITVVAVPPSALAYSQATATYTAGSAITNNTPTSSGGAIVSYSISPALPSGLSINSSTGVISGTPSAITGSVSYTVTATNTGGSTNSAVNITVNDVPPSALAYSQPTAVYTVGSVITNNTPTSSGGTVVTYSISPALPTGLGINVSTGVISGTPTVSSGNTTYTVTALNSGGSTNATVDIQVNSGVATQLAFSTQPSITGAAMVALATSPVLEVRDSGNALVASSTAKVRLMAYTDPSCTKQAGFAKAPPSNLFAATNPVTAAAGVASFSAVSVPVSGTVYLGADSPGLTKACSNAVSLATSGRVKLAFVSERHYEVGNCSRAIEVRALDSENRRVALGSSMTVTLSGTGSGLFYSDPTCTTTTSTVNINAGDSSAAFWYRNAVYQGVTFTASAAGVNPASHEGSTINNWTDPASLSVDGPIGTLVSTCSQAFTVKRRSGNSTTPTLSNPTVVNLSATLPTTFYTDPGCTASTSSVTINIGSDTATFYAISTVSGMGTVHLVDPGNQLLGRAGMLAVATSSSPASLLYFSGGGGDDEERSNRRNSCLGGGVLALDSNYDLALSPGGGTLPYSSTSGFTFYTDNHECDTSATDVSWAAGSGGSGVNFAWNSTGVGVMALDASALGLGTAALGLNVDTATPEIFDVTGPGSMTVNTCSAAFTVQTKTRMGDAVAADWPLQARLYATSGGGSVFYSDAGCTASISGVQFNIGDGSKTFYMKPTSGGAGSLYAEAPGVYTMSSFPYTVSGGGGGHYLAFSGPSSLDLNSGNCVGPYSVQTGDGPTGGNVTVNLSGSGSLSYWSGAGCSGSIGSVVVPNGSSTSSSFYVMTTGGRGVEAMQAHDIANSYSDAGMQLVVSNSTVSATNVAFNSTSSMGSGCYSVLLYATDGALPASSHASWTPTLTFTTTGSVAAGWSASSNCSSPTASYSPTLAPGVPTFQMYIQVSGSGTIQFFSGTPSGSSGVVTVASGGDHLDWSGPGSALAGSYSPVGCIGPYHLEAKNGSNVPITMSGSSKTVNLAGGAFYSDSACAASIGSIMIPVSQSQTSNFYVLQVGGATLSLVANDGGGGGVPLSNGTKSVTVTGGGGGATQFMFSLAGGSVPTNTCVGPFHVETKDGSWATVAPGSNVTVNLSANFGQFYSDAGCTAANSTVTVTTGSGGISNGFYFREASAHVVQLTAHDAASILTDRMETLIVAGAGPATNLLISGSTSFSTGNCHQFQIVSTDGSSNPANVAGNSTVTLGDGAMGGSFFSDGNCATGTGTVTINSGSATQWFFYRNYSPGNYTLTASGGGLTSASQPICVGSCGPSLSLRFAPSVPAWTTASSSSGAPVVVQLVNSSGSLTNATSTITVSLNSWGNGGFYQNSNCTSNVTTTTISSGTSASSGGLYFCDSTARVDELQASSSGYYSATTAIAMSTPAGTTKWKLAGAPVQTSNSCQGYLLYVSNGAGMPSEMGGTFNTNLSLSNGSVGSNHANGNPFYTDSNCTAPMAVGALVSLTGSIAGVWIYLKTSATAGATYLDASSGSLGFAAQLPLVAGGSAQPAMVGFDPTATLPTSGCVNVNIGVLDSSYQLIPGANNTSGTGAIQLDAVDPVNGAQVSGVTFWDGGCGGTYLNAVPSVTPASGISIGSAGKVIGIDKAGHAGPVRVRAVTSGGTPPPLATGTAVY